MADVLAALARIEARLEMLAHSERRDEPPRPSPGDEWLTAKEAAQYLGFNTMKAFYSAVQRRQVLASRLGRRLRFNRAGLDHLLRQRQGRGVQVVSRVPSPGKESERWSN
jgi:excisionase family DNA binding protein